MAEESWGREEVEEGMRTSRGESSAPSGVEVGEVVGVCEEG